MKKLLLSMLFLFSLSFFSGCYVDHGSIFITGSHGHINHGYYGHHHGHYYPIYVRHPVVYRQPVIIHSSHRIKNKHQHKIHRLQR